jgi:Cu(I)/Ag(I) efflux system membrane protein CusA/SilA
MINKLIDWCLKNRFLVVTFYLFVTGWGIYSVYHTPLDAIPDLSENQVIVIAEWDGRAPQEIEDQITYPLSTSLQGLPGVKAVRAKSTFGFGMLTIIFEDDVDLYFARTRVLERLFSLPFKLPEGVTPMLGPDATGLGWVYQYYLDDSEARAAGNELNLGQLRTIQDWFVRFQLNSVPGVAEVASIGGYVEQYQVDFDPNQLRAHGMSVSAALSKIKESNRNVGGGNIEINGQEITLRGLGYVEEKNDLNRLVLGYHNNRPVLLDDVARVQRGPAPRRGALDKDGREIVGGIVVMRYGESTLDTIKRVKEKITEIQPGLPAGIEIKAFYDQSDLIVRAVHTLRDTLIEEILLVILVNAIFLLHFRSILITSIPIPLAILISFILMNHFGVTSNIMSLAGIAIAIGVLVDAGIVMTEAVLREAHDAQEGRSDLNYPQDITKIVQRACRVVARPLFFSMAIIILAFVPVFALIGQEGKLFHPLAFTKTFAMVGATLLSVTLVPVLASLFMRGKLRDESQNPVMRALIRVYMPVLKGALKMRWLVMVAAIAFFGITALLASRLGYEFMPPLNERAFLFMPTTLPSASVPEINRVMAAQDKVFATFPEVESVVGKLGRADTATDPAPTSMIETVIMLKDKEHWRPGMTHEKLRTEMMERMMEFPGFTPALLQPIQNRILMLSTGIRGELAVKLFGSDLPTLEKLALELESVIKTVPGAADVYAERVSGAPYLEMEVDHESAALYGVSAQEVLDVIETSMGGKVLTTTIQGRKRYAIRARYMRELRDTPEDIKNVLVRSMNGELLPISKVAHFRLVMGPASISSENGMLRVFVQSNVRGRDLGGYVAEVKQVIAEQVDLPEGVFIQYGGQYENLTRATQTMAVVIPVVLFIIFLLLFWVYRSFLEAAHILLALPFALSGGFLLQWWLGYDFSVAVAVGYIALLGTAIETTMVMVIYLEEAVARKRKACGGTLTQQDLQEAVLEGSVLRLRPKLMTVITILASLSLIMIPFFSGDRTGIEVMRPLAVPIFGGMVSSLIHVLIVTPIIFMWLREWQMKREIEEK